MENLYSVRFNGSILTVCKYEIIEEHPGGLLGLNNITPGLNKLPQHGNESIHKSYIDVLREQANAYIVYIDSTDKIQDAIDTIRSRVQADKETYLLAVQSRVAEFDAQLDTISGVDVIALTNRVDAK